MQRVILKECDGTVPISSDSDNSSTKCFVKSSGRKSKIPNSRKLGEQIEERSSRSFVTGSTYEGNCCVVGMSGQGRYVMPHGVVYEGGMMDGMFHGPGVLTYPSGACIKGLWNKGVAENTSYIFADGLELNDIMSWTYCKMPDRRFYKEHLQGLQPAGRSHLTQESPPKHIPDGCYDTGDGIYDPKTKCVHSATDQSVILRIPTKIEEFWIMQHCRQAWKENIGFRPDLYENLFGNITK